jgi:hypothetical protein
MQQLRNWAAGLLLGLLSTLPANAATSTGVSPIFRVDLSWVVTGTLTGVVQAGATPVVNAQVRIDGTGFAASTGADGRFTLANVPAAAGYLLKVSAAGYAAKQVPGVTVASGTRDLGTIQLANAGGPYRLVPLQPEVNPLVTQIEAGGVGYRYYRVLSADGQTPAGNVSVSVRKAGGSTVSQAGDVSDTWAGRTAGVSDDDGLVRLRVPASAISGGTQAFEAVESGVVKASFTAQVLPQEYDQVWRQGYDLELGSASGGFKAGYATELRHALRGGATVGERVGWKAAGELTLGASKTIVGAAPVRFSGTARAGFYVGFDYASEFVFPPYSTDADENLQKIYASYAPFLKVVGAVGTRVSDAAIFEKLDTTYAQRTAARRSRTEWAGHVGGYGSLEGSVTVPWNALPNTQVKVEAKLEGEVGGFAGIENVYGRDGEEAGQGIVFGFEASTAGGVSALMQNIKFNHSAARGLGFNPEFGYEATVEGRVWTPQTSLKPTRVELEVTRAPRSSVDLTLLGWRGLEGGLGQNERVETTEKLSYTLPYPEYYNQVAAVGEAWGLLRNYLTERLRANPGAPSQLFAGILGDPAQSSQMVSYERSAYRAQTLEMPLANEVTILKRAFDLDLAMNYERGAEGVLERGVLWQLKRLPLESYGPVAGSQIPTASYWSMQEEWLRRGLPTFNALFELVDNLVDTVHSGFDVLSGGVRAASLQVQSGLGAAGQWISSSVWGRTASGGRPRARKDGDPAGGAGYGVSGFVRFDSTNAFSGTAMLTLIYSDAAVAGLNEADLRIYSLPDGSNRWQFVGGTVNAASNTVTAVISKLGTYTLAPPLPTGDLQLTASTNTLVADGVAEMTVVVTNIILNTGEILQPPPYAGGYSGSATQQWRFTAMAVGVNILNQDSDTNAPGVQVLSTNGAVTLRLRAPVGGTAAEVSLASVLGDAFGTVGINLADDTAPATPSGVNVTAGQSRIWVGWQTNSAPDLAGYRVYYRLSASGPPWEGTAAVEGTPSPVMVTGTNCLLRGLALGTNYFVAVSAVDTTGNESPLSAAIQVTMTPGQPMPPTGVTARFGADGTNLLMWALSEDDGYNDRDVARYDVLRAVLPGGSYAKVAEVAAGIGLYSGTNLAIVPPQYLGYAVVAVASNGLSSAPTLASRLMAGGTDFDNDGDGIPDWWMMQYFGHTTGQAGDQSLAQSDLDLDGLANLQEYLWGTNPKEVDRPYLVSAVAPANGGFALRIEGVFGRGVTLRVSPDLSNWLTLTNFTGTNAAIYFEDRTVTNSTRRFYRAVLP